MCHNEKTQLQDIVVSKDTSYLEDKKYQGNTSIQSLEFPSSIKGIGNFALWGCVNLERIIFHAPIESYGNRAFDNLINLQEVIIPAGMKEQFAKCLPIHLHSKIIEQF